MFQSLFFGFLSSALVAILYGAFIAQREDKIRDRLARVKTRWMRGRVIRALIDAVQGGTVQRDSGLLAGILLCFVLAFSFGAMALTTYMKTRLASAQATIDRTASADGKSLDDLKKELDDLKKEQVQGRNELSSLIDQGKYVVGGFNATATALYFLAFLGWFLWYPYVRLRALLHHDLSRLALRICCICNATDASQLLITELAVHDAPTLLNYLHTLRRIAMAHGLNADYYLLDLDDLEPGGDVASKDETTVSV